VGDLLEGLGEGIGQTIMGVTLKIKEKTGECLYIELFTWKIPHFSDFVFIPTKTKKPIAK
jgi:hypothetical protein